MSSSEQHARALVRAGGWIVLGAVVPIGAWLALAPVSMAVVAPAVVAVDLNRRPVQHLEGGIVRQVLVRDGQTVRAGEPVVILGDVGVDADRNRLRFRVLAERAGVARLEAEQALAAKVTFPQDVREAAATDERVREVLEKELALFGARRSALASEAQLLREQGRRVEEEIAALEAQIRQASAALALQTKDLEANRGLVSGGFISPARLAQIESAVVDYAARLEERRSELARAAQKRLDIELRVKALYNEYARQASDQLKAAAARLAEIEQELRKSEDAAARQVVVAPASGEVIDLRFTSPGAVVRPGEPIAEIVPSEARLTVEARVRPEDVSNVRVGQAARVRFTAFKYRSTSMAQGRVTYVSADRLVDRATNLGYYAATILVDPKALAEAGDIKVQAGMPAEVYIEGDRQTPLQYLAEPVTSLLRRAARQM